MRWKYILLARGPEAPARLRPFFLIMKLDPMKALETHASINPIKLLLYMAQFSHSCHTDISSNNHKTHNPEQEQIPERSN